MALSFQDEFNLSQLKQFASRSLNNPQWTRNADHVLSHLQRGITPTADESWPDCSEFRDLIDDAVEKVKAFRRYANRLPGARRPGNDAGADEKWAEAMTAIDALIAEAEQRHGGRLRVWR